MEEQEDSWLTVLQKNGLGPTATILDNYGIDSESDLLVLDPDDFRKLVSRGLKPLHVLEFRNADCGLEHIHEASCYMYMSVICCYMLYVSYMLYVFYMSSLGGVVRVRLYS